MATGWTTRSKVIGVDSNRLLFDEKVGVWCSVTRSSVTFNVLAIPPRTGLSRGGNSLETKNNRAPHDPLPFVFHTYVYPSPIFSKPPI